MRMITCPKCGGSGRAERGMGFRPNCSRCGGSGKIKDTRVDPFSKPR